ncbi:formimidoylglutamate deiminase [Sphingomonas sp. GB1N7]|uniref:formimidoylglutamate deiminase n=1 Tax=Parasphingomonas caseinilytica TaxID=3096158 RepID=UPI002FC75026
MPALWFDTALLPDGWATHVRISIVDGTIVAVDTGVAAQEGDERHAIAIPGLANLHSHSFQRLMAGLAEGPSAPGQDDFWGWRELMYRLVERLSPDDVAAIAAMAFMEMLEGGFTRVGEFHYLHHQPDGDPYDDPAEMAVAITAASAETGIGLTILPVFYAHSGFGAAPPKPEQRRFVTDIDGFARLHDASRAAVKSLSGAIVGIAPHSLRAVAPDELTRLAMLFSDGPIHIHIAEQVKEVADCVAWSGQRPVAWLLDHMPVDQRWCLVHATHVDDREVAALAASGAVVGLCPITEANLGDGLFPLEAFAKASGRFGIGSDSNVRIDAAEELRLLEYGQRLSLRRRGVLARGGVSTGRALFDAALDGGAMALGAAPPCLAPGMSADIVALKSDPTAMEDQVLDRWIFARGAGAIEAVWRNGRQYVVEGRHIQREAIERRFALASARALG